MLSPGHLPTRRRLAARQTLSGLFGRQRPNRSFVSETEPGMSLVVTETVALFRQKYIFSFSDLRFRRAFLLPPVSTGRARSSGRQGRPADSRMFSERLGFAKSLIKSQLTGAHCLAAGAVGSQPTWPWRAAWSTRSSKMIDAPLGDAGHQGSLSLKPPEEREALVVRHT